jgi:chitodextrinase/glucose/arabinose dehydrogenase
MHPILSAFGGRSVLRTLCLLGALLGSLTGTAQFNDNLYLGGWTAATGLTFDADGRMYVWEKSGKIYSVVRVNGQLDKRLMLDISEEVANYLDHGMLSLCLDPQFKTNRHFYLYYVVDRHHLKNFGTGSYDSNRSEPYGATITRLTRYTANPDYRGTDLGSRKILIGESASTGIPQTHDSHAGGSIIFGSDGSLMVSTGDGSSFNEIDEGSAGSSHYIQALADGIIRPDENIGAYRCQMINSLSGKILRVDPATGDGLPSNPYYNAANPRQPQSRVWAMGFRNPFRMVLKPNSGGHSPSEGNPGIIMVGDVGRNEFEELNIVTDKGQNFGWPKYEGIDHLPGWNNASRLPANLAQIHRRPAFDYRYGGAVHSSSRAWVDGQMKNIGNETIGGRTYTADIQSPVLRGTTSIAGFWYTGTNFPAEYRNTYFHGEYGFQWIRNFTFDERYNLTRGRELNGPDGRALQPGQVVHLVQGPEGEMFYIKFNSEGQSEIRRVTWGGNRLPTAVVSSDKGHGPGPLTVQFSSAGSNDPDGSALSYEWNFGDGTPVSTQANPTHTFTATGIQKYTVTLTVRDPQGGTHQTSLTISVNNTPPRIVSTSIDNISTYANNGVLRLPLTAVVEDAEHSGSGLTYEWQTILHHDDHTHPDPVDRNTASQATLLAVPCDGHLYFYRVILKVTDGAGLSATVQKDIYPNCGGGDAAPPSVPGNVRSGNVTQTGLTLSWDASTDDVGVTGYDVYQNGILIGSGSGTSYNVTGLTAGTAYSFTIKARDNSGKASEFSAPHAVTTLANAPDPVADTQAPGVPGNVRTGSVSQTSLTLSWDASTDNVGVAGYEVYQGSTLLGNVTGTSYNVTGLTAGTQYTFSVRAKDAAGNTSAPGSTTVTTASPSTPPGECVPGSVYVSDLSWTSAENGWGPVERDRANGEQNLGDGPALRLRGKTYAKGLGVHANARVVYALGGSYTRFKADIGVDDSKTSVAASIVFEVKADGVSLFRSEVLRASSAVVAVDVDLTGRQQLELLVSDAGNGVDSDHGDWADARLERSCGGTPPPVADTQAPGVPGNVRTGSVSQTSLTLSWDASTDNVGVTGYDVYQGSTLLSTVTGTTFNVTGLTAGTQYTFSVRAKDAAGNVSTPGSTSVTTAAPATTPPPAGGCTPTTTYLSDLSWTSVENEWGPVEKDRSNGEQAAGDGRTITIRGERYSKGLGVHAASKIVYALGGTWHRFKADLGIDDEVAVGGPASVVFEVWADGQRLYQSGVLRRNSPIVGINLDVTGRQQLELIVTTAGDGPNSDHADWADARLERTCSTADTQAPSVPGNVRTGSVTQTGLTLSWDASTDNVGVTGYDVYRGPVLIGTVTGTTFNVTGLTAGMTYTFSVRAKDAAGNNSAQSSAITATTSPAGTPPPPPPGECVPGSVYVSDLSWTSAENGWGPVERDRANGEQNLGDGPALRLRGKTYAKGLGVHANARVVYALGGSYTRFKADIGVDDSKTSVAASIVFEVKADGVSLFRSEVLRASSAVVAVDVDLTGRQQLELLVSDAGNGVDSDHGDWADARLERSCGGTPPPVADTQAPGVPGNVRTGSVSQTSLTLSWDASTDNVGVTGYDVYQGSTLLSTVTGTTFNVTGLTAGTQYTFSVRAKDAAGNVSTPGSTSVTTAAPATTPPPAGGCTPTTTYLSDLSWTSAENGWGPVERDRANGENSAGDGPALKLGTKTYAKGLGVHSRSEISYALGGAYTRFKADIGLADYITEFGSVVFEVFIDGTKAYESGLMTPGQVKAVDLEVTGKQQLRLVVTNADGRGRGDHANWADARLERTCSTPNARTAALRTVVPAQTAEGVVSLRTYPNPTTGRTMLTLIDGYRGALQLDILNVLGERVWSQQGQKESEQYQHAIELKQVPTGVYLLRVREGNQLRTHRLMLQP